MPCLGEVGLSGHPRTLPTRRVGSPRQAFRINEGVVVLSASRECEVFSGIVGVHSVAVDLYGRRALWASVDEVFAV